MAGHKLICPPVLKAPFSSTWGAVSLNNYILLFCAHLSIYHSCDYNISIIKHNKLYTTLHITLCIRKIKLLCTSMSCTEHELSRYSALYVTTDHTTKWVLVTHLPMFHHALHMMHASLFWSEQASTFSWCSLSSSFCCCCFCRASITTFWSMVNWMAFAAGRVRR